MSPVVILIGLIVIIIVIVGGILLLRRAEEDPLTMRIEEFAAREELVSIEDIELSMPLKDRIIVPIVRRISEFMVRFTPQKTLENTTHMLELAGNPRDMSAAFFSVARLAASFVGLILAIMLTKNVEGSKRLIYILGSAIGAFYLPIMLLQSSIDRRKQSIVKKLPDALDLMTICVDAGLTFNAAMQKVDEKWDDALASEFGRVIYEMQLGKSRRQSLKDMVDRMDVPDVSSFIAAVLQADQLGVGIGKVLRIQSEQMRIKRRQRAQEKAQQAPVKMLFPMVFLIFPSIFVVLLGPAAFQFMDSGGLSQ